MEANEHLDVSSDIDASTLTTYKERGYNEDLLPKPKEAREFSTFNYFTLWMGSVHNIPNYAAVGGFLFLGLAPIHIMLALVISSLVVAGFFVLNGRSGAKYGVPFAMTLRSSYGEKGAALPGFFRGIIAAIMWFGLQNYAGSQALLVLIARVWPDFMNVGGGATFLGIDMPGLISFVVFFIANMLIGFGGGAVLNKFTAVLNPLIYIIFGGMTIWAINVAGGISPILNYVPEGDVGSTGAILVYLLVINSVMGVWAAPGASVNDFTQYAKSQRSHTFGQAAGLLLSYLIFAFSSVTILIGSTIYYGVDTWNVVDVINRWDSLPAVAIASLVLLMTTISTNATGNIVPAGYQLSSLFPRLLNYKRAVVVAGIISFLIMPWRLMENQDSIYAFLDLVGAFLGPVAGVMMADYFIIKKQYINLDRLYTQKGVKHGGSTNWVAYIVTIVAVLFSFIGRVIPALSIVSNLSWLVGFALAFILYSVFSRKKKQPVQSNN